MSCPECEKSTAGKCIEHINLEKLFCVEELKFTYQRGRWVWQLTPICIACGKPSDFVVRLPYPSKYDDDYLCGECVRTFVDPAIVRMREERKA